MKDEGRMMKDDDFELLRGFADRQTNERTFVNVELLSRLKRLLPILLSASQFASDSNHPRRSQVIAEDDLSQKQTRKLKVDKATVLSMINMSRTKF